MNVTVAQLYQDQVSGEMIYDTLMNNFFVSSMFDAAWNQVQ